MGKIQGRYSERKSKLKWRIAALGLFILVVILGKATVMVYFKYRAASLNRNAAAVELAELEKRYSEMQANLDRLKSPEGLDEEIRKNLPVAKEGEKVITVVADKENEATASESVEQAGFWRKLLGQ